MGKWSTLNILQVVGWVQFKSYYKIGYFKPHFTEKINVSEGNSNEQLNWRKGHENKLLELLLLETKPGLYFLPILVKL